MEGYFRSAGAWCGGRLGAGTRLDREGLEAGHAFETKFKVNTELPRVQRSSLAYGRGVRAEIARYWQRSAEPSSGRCVSAFLNFLYFHQGREKGGDLGGVQRGGVQRLA